jgi:hypothetical protein
MGTPAYNPLRSRYTVEARILHNEEHYMSHTFAPWHVIPFSTPRAAAIHWAESERKAIEQDENTDGWQSLRAAGQLSAQPMKALFLRP